MIPKDPVYTLHEAVERVKATFPDVDAEGWLKDQIAADRITWGYIWNENQHDGWPPVIDILPRAATMEVSGLEIDWSEGTVIVQQRYKKPVKCQIVILRRDLDRELANAIQSRLTHPAEAETLDSEPDSPSPQLGRPRKWPWDEFAFEVTRIANTPDGLPENQADLVRTMSYWCIDKWGDQPADSSIRDQISKTYRHIAENAGNAGK